MEYFEIVFGISVLALSALSLLWVWIVHKDKVKADFRKLANTLHLRR